MRDYTLYLEKGDSIYIKALRSDKLNFATPMIMSAEFINNQQSMFLSEYFEYNENIIEVISFV